MNIKPLHPLWTHLPMDDIAAVEVHEFSPLKDFGGYGIRFNREMKAYYLRGSRGVKITTNGGKKYLIGSDLSVPIIRNSYRQSFTP